MTWTIVVLGVLSLLANSKTFVVEPQDEVLMNYKAAKALLTPEQEEFLMELLAADDALMQASSRGIIDDILQTLAGIGGPGGIQLNIVGVGRQPQPAVQPAAAVSPQSPTPTLAKTLENTTAAGAAPASPQTPVPATPVMSANPNSTALGGNNNHLFQTISSVIINSGRRNVTAIVEDSLRIATPAPIRDLVTGILNVAYCNSVRRLLGRC